MYSEGFEEITFGNVVVLNSNVSSSEFKGFHP